MMSHTYTHTHTHTSFIDLYMSVIGRVFIASTPRECAVLVPVHAVHCVLKQTPGVRVMGMEVPAGERVAGQQ